MKPQFTISPQGFVTVGPNGVVIIDHAPAVLPPGRDYKKQPVQVTVHHDLTLSLHGEKFVASKRLTPGEALGLMNMLAYVVREHLEVKRGIK